MRRALALAARGRGHTGPNPMVGATIVDGDDIVVGDGWHRQAGTPHAEIHALDAAGDRARGATLVCTLEPCSHYGRTGPCVERVVAAGIQRVVVATEDPNPLVSGRGLRFLEAHGVRVIVGVEAAAARRLNAPFFMAMRHGRPWVLLKAAVSLDGRIAAAPGVRTAISGPEADARVQRLRAEVDAIAVGSGTVLSDDPVLTARDVFRSRPFTRAIFDRRLRMPADAAVLNTREQGPVLVITTAAGVDARPEAARALQDAGAELVVTDGTIADGARHLARRDVQFLLLEGGARLQRAFLEADMIDEAQIFVSPRPLGVDGVPLLDGLTFSVSALRDLQIEQAGADVLMHGYVHRPD